MRFADRELMATLARLGFDRVSFGVQDFNPEVQAAINRIQTVEQTLAVMDAAREFGFRSISVDLIYGLPKQTLEGFARTLDTVIAAAPNRIAVYSYAHLPEIFKAQRQIDGADLPSPATKLGLLGLAIEKLDAAGWRYIGMDHFARPDDELVRAQENDTLQRNFQGYSTHAECDLIGLGVSAIGNVGDCFAQNARDLVGYYAALDAGRLPIAKGLSLSEDDLRRRELIQSIMCHNGIDIEAFEQRHGLNFAETYAAELRRLVELERDGLVTVDRSRIAVTGRGRLLVRIVAMAFDAYLARPREAVARFSRVI